MGCKICSKERKEVNFKSIKKISLRIINIFFARELFQLAHLKILRKSNNKRAYIYFLNENGYKLIKD